MGAPEADAPARRFRSLREIGTVRGISVAVMEELPPAAGALTTIAVTIASDDLGLDEIAQLDAIGTGVKARAIGLAETVFSVLRSAEAVWFPDVEPPDDRGAAEPIEPI